MGTFGRRGSRVLLLALLVLLVGYAGLLLPGPVRAEHSESSATTGGLVGCADDPGRVCPAWDAEKPEGVHFWTFADSASRGRFQTRQTLELQERYSATGTFKSVTLGGGLAANNQGGNGGNDVEYDLDIEEPGPQLSVRGSFDATSLGSLNVLSLSYILLEIRCRDVEYKFERAVDAGGNNENEASTSEVINADVDTGGNDCSVSLNAHVSGTTFDRATVAEVGSISVAFNLTIATAVPEGCDGIEGIVTDGAEPEEHFLNGVRVQLHRNGSPVGEPVATAEDGFYCMPASETVPPGDYQLRATLIDQLHQPPLFETRLRTEAAAAFAEVPVHAETFGGPEQVRVSFADPIRLWPSRVANIHFESERFVRWLTDTLGWSPSTIRPFVIRAFDDRTTQYLRGSSEVLISNGDSTLIARDQASDIAPDNAEWHEIGHHIAASLGVALPTASACAGQVNHAGWLNPSTCDSISEGFPIFLSVLGSMHIDATRGGGYATTNYAGMTDLEAQDVFPWTAVPGAGGTLLQREDFAVAALLWDLADDTSTESGTVFFAPPTGGQATVRDEIAFGGSELIDLLSALQVNTVEDLYRAAAGSPILPATASTPSIDLDGDLEPDVSALDAVFLMHGFHPVEPAEDAFQPVFRLGDAVPRTDHVPDGSSGLVSRSHSEPVPGSYVRLRNGTSAPVTFAVEVAAASGGAPFNLSQSVSANATDLLYLEVPPYYRAILGSGDALPACDAAGVSVRAITITAPGMDPQVLDTCEYMHAVVASTDGAALTVTVGPGPYGEDAATATPGPTGAVPSPASGADLLPIAVIGGALVVLLVLGLVLITRRRSRGSGPAS